MMVTKNYIKHICFSILYVMVCLVSKAQENTFTIKGNFKNWPVSRQLVFSYHNGTDYVLDTITVNKGVFNYKKSSNVPTEVSLSYDPPKDAKVKDNRRFYVHSGTIFITHSDSLKLAEITGPPLTMDYESLTNQASPWRAKMISLRMKGMEIVNKGGDLKAHPELDIDYRQALDSVRAIVKGFVKKNPSSLVALEAIKQLDGQSFSDPVVFDMFSGLDESVRKSIGGKHIANSYRIGLKTSIGALLEDFSSLDTARQPLSLADVKAKGKLTLVDFWASWCKPCRLENPHLRKVYNEFHDKGLNILAVSLDQNATSWKNAINQDQLPWYHISGLQYWDEPIVKQFGISGVPDSFLLDAEGRIIGRGLRGDKLYEAVQKALGPMDSATVEATYKRFYKEKDVQQKLVIYERLQHETTFLKRQYADVETAGMQRAFAVSFAKEGNVKEFLAWSSRMTAVVMRGIAITEGLDVLADLILKQELISLIKPHLDSLIMKQPWTNQEFNFYNNLVKQYTQQAKESSNVSDLDYYLSPIYSKHGDFFPGDIITDFKASSDGIKSSLSYQYALSILKKGDKVRAFQVLSRAVETGAFSVEEISAFNGDFDALSNLTVRLNKYLKKTESEYAVKVKNLLKKNTLTGKPLSISEIEGKYVILDFWGSWCIPCRASHPKMIELYNKYKDQGLEIVSVSHEVPAEMDKMQKNWRNAVAKDNMNWIQILNNDGIDIFDGPKEFGVATFPTKILLDKKLNKIQVFTDGKGTEELAIKLEEIFGQNKS